MGFAIGRNHSPFRGLKGPHLQLVIQKYLMRHSRKLTFWDCRGISGRFTTLRPPGTYLYFASGATSFARRPLTICDWTLFQQLVKSRLTRHPSWFEPVTSPEDLNTRQQFISGSLLLLQAHQYGTDYESRKNS
ncbi:hypothetical protein ACHWQZ_G011649 [Mnemiopsis leidyi]